MGFVVYIVMVALGEMGAWLPHKKSFSGYATRFVDPAMGYAPFLPACPDRPPETGWLLALLRGLLADGPP